MKLTQIAYTTLLMLMVFLTFSCQTSKSVQDVRHLSSQRSEEKIVIYEDTVIFSPSAVAELVFPKAVLKTDNDWIYRSQNNHAKISARMNNDTIHLMASCDSVRFVAKLKQEYYTLIENTKSNQSLTTEKKAVSFTTSLTAFFIGVVVGFFLRQAVKVTKWFV